MNATDHGYMVLVNNSSQLKHVILGSSLPISASGRLDAGEGNSIPLHNSGWEIDMPPYDAEVLNWR